MSLLSIAQAMAPELSIPVPTSILSDTGDDAVKIVRFTVAAADEITRRVDWSALRSSTTLTGTGVNISFSLPSGFSRLIDGAAIKSGTSIVRVGLSPDEWNSLTAVQGTPRFAYLTGSSLSLFPYLANAATVTVAYQSKNWSATGTSWGSDGETALIPETLIQQGAIWRWRRHMGQDYQDYLGEYEASLADLAKFDGGIRSP